MREDRFKRLVDNVCDHGGTQVIPVIPGIQNLHRFVQKRGPAMAPAGHTHGVFDFFGETLLVGTHQLPWLHTQMGLEIYRGECDSRRVSGLSPKIWDRFQVLTFPICPEPWPAGLSWIVRKIWPTLRKGIRLPGTVGIRIVA